MYHRWAAVGVVLALLVCWATDGAANSGAYNGTGGTLFPMRNDSIRMAEEQILFRQLDEWCWQVEARYVFVNITERTVKLTLGFPIVGEILDQYPPRQADPFRKSFVVETDGQRLKWRREGFVAEVDHERVAIERRKHGCDLRKRKNYCYDFVYAFPMSFGPKGRKTITYRYQVNAAGDNAWEELFVDYILNTGALWKGSIGSIELTYVFRSAQDRVVIYDGLFQQGFLGAADTKKTKDTKGTADGQVTYITEEGQRVHRGTGKVGLWTPSTKLTYTTSCGPKGELTLRLRGRDVKPRGNISLSYSNAGSRGQRGDPWICAPPPSSSGTEKEKPKRESPASH